MHIKLRHQARMNGLIHLMFNENMHPVLEGEDALIGKLKKLMQININNSVNSPWATADRWSPMVGFKEVIDQLNNMGFRYVCIWFDGTWPGASEFEDELMNSINEWNKTDWLAAGHILQRGTDAPQWHEQCVIININEFCNVDNDFYGYYKRNEQLEQYPEYKSSTTHIHDDYTPMWVAGTDALTPSDSEIKAKPEEYNDELFLNTLFLVALKNGLVIYNLNHKIRKGKICVYIEDDMEFTKEWFFDYDFNTRLSLEESRSYGYDLVSDDKRELFQYKVMDTHIMYVTNTEDVPFGNPIGIDTLVVPCSGLHQYKHISNNRDTIKRILWTDFSPFGIGWQEFVLKNWDGKDFDKFYKDNFNVITDLGLPSEEFINYDKENALDFIESYENEEDWLEHWDFIRTLDHQFVKIDVVKEWRRLSELVGKDHVALLQLSNIWQYEINYINSPDFDAQVAFVDLFNELLQNNKTIYFSGDTPGGDYFEQKNMRTLPGII